MSEHQEETVRAHLFDGHIKMKKARATWAWHQEKRAMEFVLARTALMSEDFEKYSITVLA